MHEPNTNAIRKGKYLINKPIVLYVFKLSNKKELDRYSRLESGRSDSSESRNIRGFLVFTLFHY